MKSCKSSFLHFSAFRSSSSCMQRGKNLGRECSRNRSSSSSSTACKSHAMSRRQLSHFWLYNYTFQQIPFTTVHTTLKLPRSTGASISSSTATSNGSSLSEKSPEDHSIPAPPNTAQNSDNPTSTNTITPTPPSASPTPSPQITSTPSYNPSTGTHAPLSNNPPMSREQKEAAMRHLEQALSLVNEIAKISRTPAPVTPGKTANVTGAGRSTAAPPPRTMAHGRASTASSSGKADSSQIINYTSRKRNAPSLASVLPIFTKVVDTRSQGASSISHKGRFQEQPTRKTYQQSPPPTSLNGATEEEAIAEQQEEDTDNEPGQETPRQPITLSLAQDLRLLALAAEHNQSTLHAYARQQTPPPFLQFIKHDPTFTSLVKQLQDRNLEESAPLSLRAAQRQAAGMLKLKLEQLSDGLTPGFYRRTSPLTRRELLRVRDALQAVADAGGWRIVRAALTTALPYSYNTENLALPNIKIFSKEVDDDEVDEFEKAKSIWLGDDQPLEKESIVEPNGPDPNPTPNQEVTYLSPAAKMLASLQPDEERPFWMMVLRLSMLPTRTWQTLRAAWRNRPWSSAEDERLLEIINRALAAEGKLTLPPLPGYSPPDFIPDEPAALPEWNRIKDKILGRTIFEMRWRFLKLYSLGPFRGKAVDRHIGESLFDLG